MLTLMVLGHTLRTTLLLIFVVATVCFPMQTQTAATVETLVKTYLVLNPQLFCGPQIHT